MDGYIVNFKDNHKISSKKCYFKRRPEKNLFVDKFLKNIEDLKENEDIDYIININYCGKKREKIAFLHILIRLANPKACLRAIAGISFDADKA